MWLSMVGVSSVLFHAVTLCLGERGYSVTTSVYLWNTYKRVCVWVLWSVVLRGKIESSTVSVQCEGVLFCEIQSGYIMSSEMESHTVALGASEGSGLSVHMHA